ncbi:hypothetical protein BESB_016860 [Besnoitia besnoiti]|uniref:Uncharacterized protein n=1 Tax=Besnoitia besnoiti TaxID=94643 RepID=A0A2A9M1J7_BESBE|nr:hypothetical protein BESB_016860 [Besnoitia besnoiti]PFH32368.1 hypothetical protein BESB_016860 [Besnoitia besnoiti]
MSWWRTFSGRARRETLLQGSPAYKWAVWTAGIGGGLVWIWETEKNAPVSERRIFLPAKREVMMSEAEIKKWNERYSGGVALMSPPPPPAESDDAAAARRQRGSAGRRGNDNPGREAGEGPILFRSLHQPSIHLEEIQRQPEIERRNRSREKERRRRRKEMREYEEAQERTGRRAAVSVEEAREKLRDDLRRDRDRDRGGGDQTNWYRKQSYFGSLR